MDLRKKNTIEKLSFIAFWIWAVFLFIMSIYPRQEGGVALDKKRFLLIRGDYAIHFLSYLILSSLFYYSSVTREWKSIKRNDYLFFVLLIIYSITNEVIQIFVPSRTYSIYDGLSNVIGIFLGLFFFFLIRKFFLRIIN